MYSLSLITAPGSEPVTATEAKLHTRIDQSAEDSLLVSYIIAARDHAEAKTKRQLITAIWELRLDAFPSSWIEIPLPPLQSVDSVKYVDEDGVEQTWDSSKYEVEASSGPYAQKAHLRPTYDESYPKTRDVLEAVKVRFSCGYGSAPEDVPETIRQAIKLGVAEQYENRERPDLAKAMNGSLYKFVAY